MSTDSFVLPVIDMANFPAELEKLATVATGLGCFRLINHGMPATVLAEIKAVARSLLDMPIEAKLRNVDDRIHNGGYLPPGKLGRLFETFGIYDAASPADVHSFCSIMQVSPRQREIICEYIASLRMVTIEIASKLAESLGLVGCSFHEWSCDARFHYYDFKLQEDIGYMVAPVHTDSGFLVLLQEDEYVRGLEIMNTDGSFVTIDPVPGTFLVNIGDVGKAWSNGRFNSLKHKVVCKEAMPRITILMFLLSPKDDKIEPEAILVDSNHPRLYKTFKYKEYRKAKNLSGVRTDEILPLIKKEELIKPLK